MSKKNPQRYSISNASQVDPYMIIGSLLSGNNPFWRFGSDNLFPQALAALNRKSTVHRGIIRSKARYITGKGFLVDEKQKPLLAYIDNVNADGETLHQVVRKLEIDYRSSGNAYLEIVTNAKKTFLNLYHHDFTSVRLAKEDKEVILHPDWKSHGSSKSKEKRVPLYPVFSDTDGTGNLRAVIHFKDYEPEFEHYGLPDWIAGLHVSAIAYKTDKWNISRLDNSFLTSGVLVVNGEFETPEDLEEFKRDVDDKFIGEGKQGKLLTLINEPGKTSTDGTTYTPISQQNEGDWKELHSQSKDDLIIAHGWFRTLSGISDNTGFDTKRILNEYEVALNTVIAEQQGMWLSWLRAVIGEILGYDTSTLSFINKPPVADKPPYMMIWEARKADGLPYDETAPEQQIYLANIGTKTISLQ